VAEARWTGTGDFGTEGGHHVWYSGTDNKHEQGVAFIVHKRWLTAVLDCWPVSSRIISIRLAASPFNVTIIQVYAPTSACEEDRIEEFYHDLEQVIKVTPKKDILIVQGDWNARVGPDAYPDWRDTVGAYGLGTTNERGLRLLEFAKSHNLVLANTLYPHKTSRKTTWHSPDGKTHNQIDYVLVGRRFRSSIVQRKTRTFPGADVDSDHDLVMLTMHLRLKATKKQDSRITKCNVDKLKNADVCESFRAEIGGRFNALLAEDCDVQELTDGFTKTMREVSVSILGVKKTKKKKWMTDEVLQLCDRRRQKKAHRHENSDALEEYREACRVVKAAVKRAKAEWIEQTCKEIEQDLKYNNTKKAYEAVRKLTSKGSVSHTSTIEAKDGKLLTKANEVAERWAEYCNELYNHNINPDVSILSTMEFPESSEESSHDCILREEVAQAIKSLKRGKSPGEDGVPGELLISGGEITVDIMHRICNKIWETGTWPRQWCRSVMIPIPKKGDLRKCTNYRTISLISHPSKVMLRIILNRLTPGVERILSEEQAGFRAGRSTIEQIFNIRILGERYGDHQRPILIGFGTRGCGRYCADTA